MTEQTETRRRGRPANFPDTETVVRSYNLPRETVDGVTELAARREENIGVVLNSLIQRGLKEANRSRSRRKARQSAED
jgi:hypothetical protein